MIRNDVRLPANARRRFAARPWAAQADAIVTLAAALIVAFTVVLGSELQATSGLSEDDLLIYDEVIGATAKQFHRPFHIVETTNAVPFVELWSREVENLHGVYRRAVFDMNNKSERDQDLRELSRAGYETIDSDRAVLQMGKRRNRFNYMWLSTIGYNPSASTAVVIRAYHTKDRHLGSGLYLLVFEYGRWRIEEYIAFRKH